MVGTPVESAVAAARRAVAAELHDGVVQLLAHLRLELEYLARHGGDDAAALREEAERLAATAGRGLEEVRGLVEDLARRGGT